MRINEYPASVDQKAEYSAQDVAIILGQSKPTVIKKIDAGQFPGSYKSTVGKADRRVPAGGLAHYIDANYKGDEFRAIQARIKPATTPDPETQEPTANHADDTAAEQV